MIEWTYYSLSSSNRNHKFEFLGKTISQIKCFLNSRIQKIDSYTERCIIVDAMISLGDSHIIIMLNFIDFVHRLHIWRNWRVNYFIYDLSFDLIDGLKLTMVVRFCTAFCGRSQWSTGSFSPHLSASSIAWT